jgi:hypothetical protein
MSSKFNWNRGAGPGRNVKNRESVAHAALDSQVMKDTDPYVPFRTGMLAGSPMRTSKVGLIRYSTPYARKCYYGDSFNFRKVFHPQAASRWLEKSRAVWMRQWTRIVNHILVSRR